MIKTVNAAVLCIGSELLQTGKHDSNGPWFRDRLSGLGFTVSQTSVIADDEQALRSMLTIAVEYNDLVIITGGLGGTRDDITVEVTAGLFDLKRIHDKLAMSRLENLLLKRYSEKAASRMIKRHPGFFTLEEAEQIEGITGIASAHIIRIKDNKTIVLLPGVPSENKPLYEALENELASMTGSDTGQLIKRIWGQNETEFERRFFNGYTLPEGTSYGVSFSTGSLQLFFHGRSDDLQKVEERLYSTFGRHHFCDDLVADIAAVLSQRDERLATAESCTGGMIASYLTDRPGSSQWFNGSCVTYANNWKEKHLTVDPQVIEKYGAVSEQTVQAMSRGLLAENADTDWVISVSGIAGPDGGTKEKPVGTVHTDIARRHGDRIIHNSYLLFYPSDRERIRTFTTVWLINRLRLLLLHVDSGKDFSQFT